MSNQIIYTEKAPEPIGPYSQAVLAGSTLYISGQIAFEASQNGTLEEETTQVMENIGAILSAAGYSYLDVVKCSIFLKSMDDFAEVNEVYGRYYKNKPPARETVQVACLPKNVNVEISAIAVK
ncbi:Rid family detoxifying hydrolase [Jiulongibacter sediminis]|uniref:DfrA n=1 Tax=Jiulongibacter sediminis TaxID=1605367 RepID=A0A0P7C3V7_9BACT|nr:Rid family detoxifying hydrolase [Jiulongibacter sediminis]KPM47833.1 dfrA [Jiulongibacter sediminis]TBX24018.1 dfrA [Jiulongibacter sediminis]